MSFNYLEVARVAEFIQDECSRKKYYVKSVQLVEFANLKGLTDLNIGIELSFQKQIVFSLKAPWVACFFGDSRLWRDSTQKWSTAFGLAIHWNKLLVGKQLLTATAILGDRSIILGFSDDVSVRIDLFPARPNWLVQTSETTYRWRDSNEKQSVIQSQTIETSHEGLQQWMIAQIQSYADLRKAFLKERILHSAIEKVSAELSRISRKRKQMLDALKGAKRWSDLYKEAENLKAKLDDFKKIDALFQKAKKMRRTQIEVQARLKDLDHLQSKASKQLSDLREGILPEQVLEVSRKEPGIKKFISKDEQVFWVGRNRKENEILVQRLARGNDMWLHLKGKPGAHGIIHLEKSRSASLDSLLDAATMVAYYSGFKASERVEIDYTFRKYVKRIPGAGPHFLVTYSQNKTLMVILESVRLERLLAIVSAK